MQSENIDKNLAHGHRQRLRDRYINCGIESLSEHEMLEFLLFYAIPRKDTKPLAKNLLKEYGSLEAVLTTAGNSPERSGLSQNSALLFRLLSDFNMYIQRHKACENKIESIKQMGDFFLGELKKDPTERMIMLLLDCKNCVISFETICVGGFTSSNVNMRRITELALFKKAAKVAVAHNHPSGVLKASMQDYVATKNIDYILSQIDIELVEHFIVTPDGFIGIKDERNKESQINQSRSFSGYDYSYDV